jgi:hypothetical protein
MRESSIALRFTEHAIDRMLDWDVDPNDIAAVLATGETIEEYDDGSRLVLGRRAVRPIHVVAADVMEDTTVVITVYEPSSSRWDATFRARRPQ